MGRRKRKKLDDKALAELILKADRVETDVILRILLRDYDLGSPVSVSAGISDSLGRRLTAAESRFAKLLDREERLARPQ